VTTTAMIQKHPYTVQAVVTGITEMVQYAHTHSAQAEKFEAQAYASAGITSPEEDQYLFFTDGLPYMGNPYMTKAQYNNTLLIVNNSSSTKTAFPYATFFVSRFVVAAEKALAEKLP
jgi:hypothetical protein